MTCGEWDNVVADDEIVERAMDKVAEEQVRHVTTRYVREEVIAERDQRIAELEAENAQLRERLSDLRRPTHGPCCTCQCCGKNYDDCRCNLDAVVDDLEKSYERIAELEAAADEYILRLRQSFYAGDEGVRKRALAMLDTAGSRWTAVRGEG